MARSHGSTADLLALTTTLQSIEERFGSQPARIRFIVGGIRELSRVAADLSLQQLRHLPPPASGGRKPEFSRALVEQLTDHLPVERDPLARARARGLLAQRDMLNVDGPPMAVTEVAQHINITRQAVDKRRQAGKLLAVSFGTRNFSYPRWQFTNTGILPGLQEVLHALEPHPPWAQLRFFVSGNHRLGRDRPIDWLRKGRVEQVLQAAEAFGEHGAA